MRHKNNDSHKNSLLGIMQSSSRQSSTTTSTTSTMTTSTTNSLGKHILWTSTMIGLLSIQCLRATAFVTVTQPSRGTLSRNTYRIMGSTSSRSRCHGHTASRTARFFQPQSWLYQSVATTHLDSMLPSEDQGDDVGVHDDTAKELDTANDYNNNNHNHVTDQVISNSKTSNSNTKTTNPFLTLWEFTRPHTLIGSALAVPAIHGLAAPSWQACFSRPCMGSILYATIPALLMNLYVTGLNQITDVEIDRINKPELPIAKGTLKPKHASIIVTVALLLSLTLGHYGTPGLRFVLWGSGILGTLYSLPPFRLKRFPLLAAFCIVAVRGFIINASFYAHAQAAAFQQTNISVLQCLQQYPKCLWSSLFFGVFGIVIALMKDVPDVKGDAQSNVKTFSVRLGQTQVFHGMKRLLQALFGSVGVGVLLLSLTSPTPRAGVVACRLGLATFCAWAARSIQQESIPVDPMDSQQVYGYYMWLWKLFYLSYLALPLAR